MIRRRANGYDLVSTTGKVLGHHKRKADALAQERAIQIAQHLRSKGISYDEIERLPGFTRRRVKNIREGVR